MAPYPCKPGYLEFDHFSTYLKWLKNLNIDEYIFKFIEQMHILYFRKNKMYNIIV